jgi:hypothetical protein
VLAAEVGIEGLGGEEPSEGLEEAGQLLPPGATSSDHGTRHMAQGLPVGKGCGAACLHSQVSHSSCTGSWVLVPHWWRGSKEG